MNDASQWIYTVLCVLLGSLAVFSFGVHVGKMTERRWWGRLEDAPKKPVGEVSSISQDRFGTGFSCRLDDGQEHTLFTSDYITVRTKKAY